VDDLIVEVVVIVLAHHVDHCALLLQHLRVEQVHRVLSLVEVDQQLHELYLPPLSETFLVILAPGSLGVLPKQRLIQL